MYDHMQTHTTFHPSVHAYVALLKACACLHNLDRGRELHIDIARFGQVGTSVFIDSALVDMYAKCGRILKAQEVFYLLPEKNIVSWTALITGYVNNGHAEDALQLLEQMDVEGIYLDAITFVCALKACADVRDANRGQVMHIEIIKRGFERDTMITSTLVFMYAKCNLLTIASTVFCRFLDRDVVLWSTIIAAYVEGGCGDQAIQLYKTMKEEGVCPDQVIYLSIIKACSSLRDTNAVQNVHSEVTEKGMDGDIYIVNTLIDVYTRCGLLPDAYHLLRGNSHQTVISWNALLAGYVDSGHYEEALSCIMLMRIAKVSPDSVTYICYLKACSNIGDLMKGYEIHCELTIRGIDKEAAVGSSLVDMYGKCGNLVDAQVIFNNLVNQDVISWNSLITGYVDHSHGHEAIACLDAMQDEGVVLQSVALVGGLRACGNMKFISKGQEIHTDIAMKGLESSTFVAGSLVDMYVKCGSLIDAQNVFNNLSAKDVILWNTLLVGFVDHESYTEAFNCIELMQCEDVCLDDVSIMCGLKACGALGNVTKGWEIHSELLKKGWEGDIFVSNTLIDMYINCSSLKEAWNIFEKLPVHSVVSWNSLVLGYIENGHESEALKCFEKMHEEGVMADPYTFICNLKACSAGGSIVEGRKAHFKLLIRGFDTNVLIGNALVDMYSRCGSLMDAEAVLNRLCERTTASWNALIARHMESGNTDDALYCYDQMHSDSIAPDELTFVCCLRSCGNAGSLTRGEDIYSDVLLKGLECDDFVGNTLIDMYSKCGLLEEAEFLLNKLSLQTVYSWNAIITGYSQRGESQKVFLMFKRLLAAEINPNTITFVSILNVCNHTGELSNGYIYYVAMGRYFDIIPVLQHITCIVDLLGRSGCVDVAVFIINTMPFHPGLVIWHTILGACRKWSDKELGKCAFEHALQINGCRPATYICMSNIYADIESEEGYEN
ncbi:hypothetical protein KP509_28G056200 [Ceratopteris richardii]|nr:hypothetical protein KP509_28G056200 [Ceratopteris richardii]